MQTRKRAKPVKFGLKKESPSPIEEKLAVVQQPEENETKVVSHQKIIRISESDDQESSGKPIIISQNVQITKETEEDITEEPEEREEPQTNPVSRPLFTDEPGEAAEKQASSEVYQEEKAEDTKQFPEREDEKNEEEFLPPAFITKESSFGKGFRTAKEEEPVQEEVQQVFRGFGNDDYEEEKKSHPFLFFIIVVFVTFFLGLLLIGGVTFFTGDKSLSMLSLPSFFSPSEPTPPPTEEPEPSPTPEEKVDLGAYSIQILNGSGVTGEAGKLKEALTGTGFSVSAVGNAGSNDYTQTQITFKPEVKQPFIKALQEELEKSYSVGSATEDATQTTDVVVTIGSQTAN